MRVSLAVRLRVSGSMLLASLLVACGAGLDEDGGVGLDNLPGGTSQLSIADRTAVGARLTALVTALDAEDPVAALAIGRLREAFVSDGWITGADADLGATPVPGEERFASVVVTERWGVLVGDVVVLTAGSPIITGRYVRGIVALRSTRTVVAYGTQDFSLGQPLGGNFPASARGLIFEGTTSAWEATAGELQLSTAQQLFRTCGYVPAGVTCVKARYTGSIGITTSGPLASLPGNTASGSRSFSLVSSSIRGYAIEVSCDQSTMC